MSSGDTAPESDGIEAQAKRLCTSIRAAAAEHQRASAHVASERESFEVEKRVMSSVQEFSATRIKLDVGGQYFSASLEALRRVPGSMLAAMFSGRYQTTAGDDGAYFIDRDGTHFRYILNYLRTGAVSAPSDPVAKAELATEADYYCLGALACALRAPALDLSELLGTDITRMPAVESEMRQAFVARAALDSHAGLTSVFADPATAASLVYTPDPQGFPTVASLRPAGETGCRVRQARSRDTSS